MIVKYLAAVNTNERGIAYVSDKGESFSTRSFAKKFDVRSDAVRAAQELEQRLKKDGFTETHAFETVAFAHDIADDTDSPSDAVQSPAHYQLGDVEAIDVIDQSVEDPASFYRGNAIKYLLRAGRKGDAHEDLRKARYYIDRELDHE